MDVNAPLYEFANQQNIPFEIPVSGGQADVWDGIPMYTSNLEGGISSGNPSLSCLPPKNSNLIIGVESLNLTNVDEIILSIP